MKNKRVAVLDIRSFEVTFLIGSRGVNNTFIVCGSETKKYEGFSASGFIDKQSFRDAVCSVVESVRKNYDGTVEEIYISAPSAFLTLKTKGHTISFPSKRKISSQDVEVLFDGAQNDLFASGVCVRRSAMYFAVGDHRKYFKESDLFGVPTSLLKGALSYYFLDAEFYDFLNDILNGLGIQKLNFIPASLSHATYLLPQTTREGYALFLDVGFLCTTFSVVYGNGIVREESFDYGTGLLIANLMNAFNVEYSVAEEMLRTANVSERGVPRDLKWTDGDGKGYPVWKINDVIKLGFDELSEKVGAFLQTHYGDKKSIMVMNAPLFVTGEGVTGHSGLVEHLTGRINHTAQIVAPELPYYDKPVYSSRMALLNMALGDEQERGFFKKFFNLLGGRKK